MNGSETLSDHCVGTDRLIQPRMHFGNTMLTIRQLPHGVLQLGCQGLAGVPGQVLLGVLLPDLLASDETQLGLSALPPPGRQHPDAGDSEQRPPGRVEAALHDLQWHLGGDFPPEARGRLLAPTGRDRVW